MPAYGQSLPLRNVPPQNYLFNSRSFTSSVIPSPAIITNAIDLFIFMCLNNKMKKVAFFFSMPFFVNANFSAKKRNREKTHTTTFLFVLYRSSNIYNFTFYFNFLPILAFFLLKFFLPTCLALFINLIFFCIFLNISLNDMYIFEVNSMGQIIALGDNCVGIIFNNFFLLAHWISICCYLWSSFIYLFIFLIIINFSINIDN
eukprot:gene6426-4632_t